MKPEDFVDTSWKQIEQMETSELSSPQSYPSPCSPRVDMLEQDEQHNTESLMLLLNKLDSFDEAIRGDEAKQGTATFLIQTLHNIMTNRDNAFRRQIRKSQALQVSLICSALETVFRCSHSALKSFVETMPVETLPTLAVVVEVFIDWRGSQTVRDVALHKTARIFNYLCSCGIPTRIVLVEALFVLLKVGSTDTSIDAATALASLATRRHDALYPPTIERIEQQSRFLISILSTAALSLSEQQASDVVDALLRLTTSSEAILVNFTRRPSALRALQQCMKSTMPDLRRNSLIIASALLGSCPGFTELFAVEPLNGKLLLKGLATSVLYESEVELQHFAMSIVTKALANMNGTLDHIGITIETLVTIAFTAIQERTSNQAALALCIKAPSLEGTSHEETICSSIAELTQSSSQIVRSEALRTLWKLCSRLGMGHTVVRQDSFRRAMILNLTKGKDEASAALAILVALSRERQNRDVIRQTSDLLDVVVDMTIQNKVEGRSDYMACVELVLLLMTDDSGLDRLLHYTELLPWLAALANSNISSKELKTDTVDTIVRFTSRLLQS